MMNARCKLWSLCVILVAWPAAAVHANAIAHWSFDETSGTNIADDIGGHDGTKTGAGTLDLSVAGQFGTAGNFDGGTWLNVGAFNDDSWRSGDFTVATWVKLDNTAGNQNVFSKWWNPWEFRFEVGNGGGSDLRNSSNVTFVGGNTPAGDTNWHHVAWVHNDAAGTLAFYRDGVLVNTFAGTPNQDVRNTGAGLNIARKGDSGNNLEGTLDELWLFSNALTTGEIGSLKANNDTSVRVVNGAVDWVNIIDANETQSSWTEQVVVSDGGESVTLDITLTNAAGEVFSRRDGNARFAVGVGSDGNGIESNEDVTLTVSLVSSTSKVDPDSIGFNFTGAGLRSLSGAGVGDWTSSVTISPLAIGGDGSDLNPMLDSMSLFHLLNGSDYSGTLDVTGGFFQLTDLGSPGGLQYSVSFAIVPAPAALPAGLAMLGFVAARRRRYR